MSKYEVDANLFISGKIREVFENEDGVFYQLRVKYRDGATNISMSADDVYPETGTYNIDDYVHIVGKVLEIIKNDDGTFYNLKVKYNGGTTSLMIEEQYIKGVKPNDQESSNNTENEDENQGETEPTTPTEPETPSEPDQSDPDTDPNTNPEP